MSKLKAIVIWFAFLLMLLWMTSCGSRNVKKTEIKEDEKKDISIKKDESTTEKTEKDFKKETETEKKTENDIVDIEENLEPIDPAKPMVKKETQEGNTKVTTWENAKVNNKSKTDKSKTDQKEKTSEDSKEITNKESKAKTDITQTEKRTKKQSDKETERQTGFPWWTLWFLLLIPAYFAYRKYKSSFIG